MNCFKSGPKEKAHQTHDHRAGEADDYFSVDRDMVWILVFYAETGLCVEEVRSENMVCYNMRQFVEFIQRYVHCWVSGWLLTLVFMVSEVFDQER